MGKERGGWMRSALSIKLHHCWLWEALCSAWSPPWASISWYIQCCIQSFISLGAPHMPNFWRLNSSSIKSVVMSGDYLLHWLYVQSGIPEIKWRIPHIWVKLHRKKVDRQSCIPVYIQRVCDVLGKKNYNMLSDSVVLSAYNIIWQHHVINW
jgi:hypothetical protein